MDVFLTDMASFHSYLIGEWISLPMEEDELSQTIKRILKKGEEACADGSIHEEYFLTDWEGEEFFQVGEYTNVFKLNEEVAHFNELDLEDYQIKSVKFLMKSSIVSNLDEAIEKMEETVLYEETSFLDLAYQIVEEQYNLDDLPQFIANYFDYEALARDLELEGFYHEIDGDIFYYPY